MAGHFARTAEAVGEHRHPADSHPMPPEKLGFYGYAAGDGRSRVVRLGWVGNGKPPKSITVDCTVCAQVHRVEVAWREPVEMDVGREPEAVLRDAG